MLKGEQVHDLKTHEMICQALLGAPYTIIHQTKDKPSKWYGKGHRKYYHDNQTNMLLALLTKDPKAFAAGVLHDFLDYRESEFMRQNRKKNFL